MGEIKGIKDTKTIKGRLLGFFTYLLREQWFFKEHGLNEDTNYKTSKIDWKLIKRAEHDKNDQNSLLFQYF